MRKMRLLTFMQMAETKMEMDFALIQQELVLGPQAVEEFVIDGMLFFFEMFMCIGKCRVHASSVTLLLFIAWVWVLFFFLC